MSDYQSIERTKKLSQETRIQQVKRFIFNYRWPILIWIVIHIIIFIIYLHRVSFFQGLERVRSNINDLGFKGYALMFGLVYISAFPPIFGYAILVTFTGYFFGFYIGFPLAYFGGLLGSITCFLISRYFLHDIVHRFLSRYSNLEAVIRTVEKREFKLFVFIRMSPYPFNMLNFFFSATSISLSQYALGTGIAALVTAFDVFAGANLAVVAKHVLGTDGDLTPEELRMEKIKSKIMLPFTIFMIIILSYIFRRAKKAIEEVNQPDALDQEEQEAFLNEVHD